MTKIRIVTLLLMLISISAIAQSKYKKSITWGVITMDGTTLEKCQALKAAGFDGVEFNSHMDREECLAALKATGLKASSLCNSQHWKSLMSSADAQEREKGVEAMIVAMEDAKAYGTDIVLLVPGRVSEEMSYDQCWERSTECIEKLVPIAEKMGVTIAIENVWNNFLLSPMEAARYIDQFNSDRVKFYFDCGNIVPYGWPEQWIKILGNRIGRIHIKEYSTTIANEKGKGAGFNAPLCEGTINWCAIIDALDNVGYSSWLTIEHKGGDSPEGLKELARRLDIIINKDEFKR